MLRTSRTAYNRGRGDADMPLTIHVVIHPAEEGGYWAESKTIAGAFTQGETVQETECRMYEAVDLLLEDDYPDIKEYGLSFEVSDA